MVNSRLLITKNVKHHQAALTKFHANTKKTVALVDSHMYAT